jgi:hypothetical protein
MAIRDLDIDLSEKTSVSGADSIRDLTLDSSAPEQKETTFTDIAAAAAGGVNELVPALLGLPMDTLVNIANLGVAAAGVVKGQFGGELPETFPPQPLGSEFFKEKITGLIGASPFDAPDPTDPAQQKAKMAGGIIGAGLLSPATSGKQVASNVAQMVPAAAGAVAAQEAFPDQPLAPLVGSVAGGVAVPAASATLRSMLKKPEAAFIKAHRLGYKVPPSQAKKSKTQDLIEGVSGPVPTKQQASVFNQKVTNDLIKKDIGYPEDIPISIEGLHSIRVKSGQAFEKARGFGNIPVDNEFRKALSTITKKGSALSKELPGLVNKDVKKFVKMFDKNNFSSEALVDATKQLRSDANAGFKSSDPSTLAMARAKSVISSEIDHLIERAAKTKAPDLVKELQAARTTIAKTYDVQKALKGDNVDAVALGRALDKGKPFTGGLRDVAEFGQKFKGSAQVTPPQITNFRPADILTGIGGAVASNNVAWLAAAGIRPALRKVILSKPYQNLVAKMPPGDWKAVLNLPAKSQLSAMAFLLEEFNSSQKENPESSPQ